MVCTESVVFVATPWSAFSLGTIYLFTQSAEQVFGELYGFSAVQSGYVQAAVVIGEILAGSTAYSPTGGTISQQLRNTEIPGTEIPEARLYQALVGGLVGVTGGISLPAIALAMIGAGTTSVLVSIANYLVDVYSKYAGSAVGAIGLGENIFIAFLPTAAQSMYTNLGFQWASLLLCFVLLVLAFAPVAVFIWGKQIRARSPFMKEAAEENRRDSVVSAPTLEV